MPIWGPSSSGLCADQQHQNPSPHIPWPFVLSATSRCRKLLKRFSCQYDAAAYLAVIHKAGIHGVCHISKASDFTGLRLSGLAPAWLHQVLPQIHGMEVRTRHHDGRSPPNTSEKSRQLLSSHAVPPFIGGFGYIGNARRRHHAV